MSTFRVLENSELRGPIECYHPFLPSSTRHTKRVGSELRTSTHEGALVTVSSLTRGLRYLLATCTFTPLYGRLSNVMGRRGANQTAVFFAALGTLACGLSTSMETLIAARFVWISSIFDPPSMLTFTPAGWYGRRGYLHDSDVRTSSSFEARESQANG